MRLWRRHQRACARATNRPTQYSPRCIQQLIKEAAPNAQITPRVYPHLPKHSAPSTLLNKGMRVEPIQKFPGPTKLESTQICAESTPEMIQASCQKAEGT
jgi:site-specific recombinase XerD